MTQYQQYLKSNHWGEIRKETYTRNNFCYICGSQNRPLNIHHLTYKNKKGESNLNNERIEDLVVLCEECHNAIHKHYKKRPQTRYTIELINKKYREFLDIDLAIINHKKDAREYFYKKKKRPWKYRA